MAKVVQHCELGLNVVHFANKHKHTSDERQHFLITAQRILMEARRLWNELRKLQQQEHLKDMFPIFDPFAPIHTLLALGQLHQYIEKEPHFFFEEALAIMEAGQTYDTQHKEWFDEMRTHLVEACEVNMYSCACVRACVCACVRVCVCVCECECACACLRL